MFLTDPSQLRVELGFDDMLDITAAVRAAVSAATPALAARIGTEFDEGTFTDYFYVPEPTSWSSTHATTEFRLRRGFVSAVSAFSYATTRDMADAVSVVGDVVTDALARERGVIRDLDTRYSSQFVSVTYDAGFPPDDADADMFDLDVVPSWLQEAAKTWALLSLASSPSLKNAQVELDTRLLRLMLDSVVGSKLRYAPSALLPL